MIEPDNNEQSWSDQLAAAESLGATAAALTFLRNTQRMGDLVAIMERAGTDPLAHLDGVVADRALHGDIDLLQQADEVRARSRRAIDFVNQWYIVMQVTFTETYLQDVLAACARVDRQIMKDSEQAATLDDVLRATDLRALADELRSRWARSFVDKGGPTTWCARLVRMGVKAYPAGMVETLEEVWGFRHNVVHRAGIASTDFVKRHPTFGASVGEPLLLSVDELLRYLSAVNTFVRQTDFYFRGRIRAATSTRER